ncbi:MAG: T9SS type A sorting domain-containing protein, partial [Bacteroidota bacterium]
KKSLFLLLGLLAFLSLPGRVSAQGLALGQVSGLVGDTVAVPVSVTGSNPLTVSAMTLGVNYDSTRLRCLSSLVNVQPAVTTANLLSNCGFFSGTGAALNASYFGSTSGRLALPRLVSSNQVLGLELGRTVRVPVLAGTAMEMGAFSLDLPWPSGLELVSIKASMGQKPLLHNLMDGRLRMGWASTEGHQVCAGDVLFEMEVLAEEGVDVDFASVNLGSMSEIADPMAQTLANAALVMPKLSSKARPSSALQVWPNPAHDAVHFGLLVEPGIREYSVQCVDAVGRVVKAENQSITGQEIRSSLSLEGLATGSYMLKITLLDAFGSTKTMVQRLQVR